MPILSPEDKHLTVLNLFTTDKPENQDRLITEMRKIVDTAAFEGWLSSTVHAGQESPGTANFIQWRSGEDLEARYAGEEFKHRTLPVFGEITTSIRLLQNEIVYTQRHPSQGSVTEVSPDRDDFTVIEVFKTTEENQARLVEALGEGQKWLVDVPGYRSHTVFRGLRARFMEGAFAVVYSQWESKEAHDAYRTRPEADMSETRRNSEATLKSLATERDWNSYRVVHSRKAGE
ncbi:antibiotic biosynthesis monooxygenase [Streptomyces sp. WAC 06738]|uniref:antibiotic biosynthesis monooxygenase family protein n=1 Tax=Streptomyces sp. WAC 06738 TaxID=2203210 RepID=UPI000F6E43CF|nr:antibiotic biosynthesis monooxygenase family protein [Streptomyces sp. WAC 06738]AZM49770.1 antibiotic biosynthesis monooxygenase [Streptomyces sp. WAC 06738]